MEMVAILDFWNFDFGAILGPFWGQICKNGPNMQKKGGGNLLKNGIALKIPHFY